MDRPTAAGIAPAARPPADVTQRAPVTHPAHTTQPGAVAQPAAAPDDLLARARRWTWRALLAYGLGVGTAGAAAIPVLLAAVGELDDAPRMGQAAIRVLAFLLVAAALGYLGARSIMVGRAVAAGHGPRALLRAAQAMSLLVGALGILHLVSGRPVLGLADLAGGLAGLAAAAAWTSRVPGGVARASALAVGAAVLYAAAALHPSHVTLPPTEATFVAAPMVAAVLPSGAAVVAAAAALLAHAILRQSPNRILGPALLGVAGLLAAVHALVAGLDFLGARWPSIETSSPTVVASLVLAFFGVLATLVAAVCGILAAAYAVTHYAPPLVTRAGTGFTLPDASLACPRCGLVPPYRTRFCPDCGEPRPAAPA